MNAVSPRPDHRSDREHSCRGSDNAVPVGAQDERRHYQREIYGLGGDAELRPVQGLEYLARRRGEADDDAAERKQLQGPDRRGPTLAEKRQDEGVSDDGKRDRGRYR